MAGECTESTIATSSATPNWWSDLHTNSLSASWSSNTNTNPWHPHHHNPNSNSSGEEDLSISNQSGLTVDSSRHLVDSSSANEFIGDQTASDHSQLWSHVLLNNIGSRAEMNNSTQEVGGKYSTNLFASKSCSSTGMFEPAACSDYLKKMDNSWEFTNSPSSFNNFDQKQHFNGFNHGVIESEERLTKLSNLVSNWSIAPPDHSAGLILNHHHHHFDLSHMKQQTIMSNNPTSTTTTPFGGILNRGLGSFSSCYGHDHTKVKDEYRIGLSNSFVGDNSKYYYGTTSEEVPCSNISTRSFSDVMNFSSSYLSKPSVGMHGSKSIPRSLHSDCKKQPSVSTTQTVARSNLRAGQGITTEGKKKRSEENSDTALKKPKHDSSTVSSSKVPKVKVGDKITALQQIVSPFGKTDTASVLWEAIGYIRFLQEQVQLLSNPYMKTNTCKDPWGGLERMDRGDLVFDLQSRGLCLVPISCTPQACRETTGADYWTPTYRGCLYR